jgi:hypothetical protein
MPPIDYCVVVTVVTACVRIAVWQFLLLTIFIVAKIIVLTFLVANLAKGF